MPPSSAADSLEEIFWVGGSTMIACERCTILLEEGMCVCVCVCVWMEGEGDVE